MGSEALASESSCPYGAVLLRFAVGVAELSSRTSGGNVGKPSSAPNSSASDIDSGA